MESYRESGSLDGAALCRIRLGRTVVRPSELAFVDRLVTGKVSGAHIGEPMLPPRAAFVPGRAAVQIAAHHRRAPHGS